MQESDADKGAGARGTALELRATNERGAALGLRAGDQVVAIDGTPLTGGTAELTADLAPGRGPRALGVRRGDATFPVLADTSDLGRWVAIPAPEGLQPRALDPDTLCNWELFRDARGRYDLQPLTPSLWALVATPLWLAHNRLWTPLAVHLSATVSALPVGVLPACAVYALGSVYVWRAARMLFRVARQSEGMQPFALVAASAAREAHALCATLAPDLRHVDASPAPAEPAAIGR
ncbi:hypothetical protein [Rhodosalinus sp.]|uniref:hypothetical protein n=1 Tax=Rhodosalinus sp. TaxID=2047741 RepID=UPI00397890C9